MELMDSHDEGVRWLTLAAGNAQNITAKRVCLERAIQYLEEASQYLAGTERYGKSLRNLAMAYWLLGKASMGQKTCSPDTGRIFKSALENYVVYLALEHSVEGYKAEYERCLEDALTFCEELPPKEALGTIELYLGIIPVRQGANRYKCLLKMSDILDHHAKNSTQLKHWTFDHVDGESAPAEDIKEHKEAVTERILPQPLEPEHKKILNTNTHTAESSLDQLQKPDLTPREAVSILRHLQHPNHSKYHLSDDPEGLSEMTVLVEVGKAKTYFQADAGRRWLERSHPGLHGKVLESIGRVLALFRTEHYALGCITEMRRIHKHSAYQTLNTMHSIYNILTFFPVGFSPPEREIRTLARVKMALDKALVCVEGDRIKVPQDCDARKILQGMADLLKEARDDLQIMLSLEKQAHTPGITLDRLSELWEPYQDLLPEYKETTTPLPTLLALRVASNLAQAYDKDDFILILRKCTVHYETETMVHEVITELLQVHQTDPMCLLATMFQAYPPSNTSGLVMTETGLRSLTTLQLRGEIDLALARYTVRPGDSSAQRQVSLEARHILNNVREQFNRPK